MQNEVFANDGSIQVSKEIASVAFHFAFLTYNVMSSDFCEEYSQDSERAERNLQNSLGNETKISAENGRRQSTVYRPEREFKHSLY